MGDEKLSFISVAVRGINVHIRFYSEMLCTAAINTSNTTRTRAGEMEWNTNYRRIMHIKCAFLFCHLICPCA